MGDEAPPPTRTWLWYVLGVVLTPLLLSRLGLTGTQMLSTLGFCTILYGAIFFWRWRLAFAWFGISGLLAFKLLDLPHLLQFASLDIILFLVAMMTIIGFMEEKQFFTWVIDQLLLWVGPHPRKIMIVLMVSAAVSAALVDEVTSILFMVAAMLNLLGRTRLNPIPYLLMLVFATNIGSSATVVGNPVGVIIAFSSGLTFTDFLRWATPIAVVCLAVCVAICLRYFKRDIAALKPILTGERGEKQLEQMVDKMRISKKGVRTAGWLFGAVIAGLVFHHSIEHLLGLPRNTMLLGVALIGAAFTLALSGDKARELIEKRVDWWTLLFFMMLFASVGTLKQTGVTAVLAQDIIALSGGSVPILASLFTWSAGLLTAVMDNVLAVATFIPIVSDVAQSGLTIYPLWWAMLFGGTLMGNATLIGSTANIVAAGVLERRQLGAITFAQWLAPGMLVAIATTIIANLLLLAQLGLMPAAIPVHAAAPILGPRLG